MDELKQLQERYNVNKLKEQSIKVLMNSIYGSLGFPKFKFYNKAIAETITKQSQLLINAAGNAVNAYFLNVFPNDKDLHEKLHITKTRPLQKEVWFYTDTDSCFFTFQELREKCTFSKNLTSLELCTILYEERLDEVIKLGIDEYFKEYNAHNYMTFDLEYIASRAIWVSKKNYIVRFVMLDGVELDEIKISGLPAVKSNTPSFFRKKLKQFYDYIMEHDGDEAFNHVINFCKDTKRQMKMENIDDLCENVNVNNYRKHIIDDRREVTWQKGTLAHFKASAYYNHFLYKNELLDKYQLIKNGDKVKIYFTSHKDIDKFAYHANDFPKEIAPKLDYDMQFQKYFLKKINDILKLTHNREISPTLTITKKLF